MGTINKWELGHEKGTGFKLMEEKEPLFQCGTMMAGKRNSLLGSEDRRVAGKLRQGEHDATRGVHERR